MDRDDHHVDLKDQTMASDGWLVKHKDKEKTPGGADSHMEVQALPSHEDRETKVSLAL